MASLRIGVVCYDDRLYAWQAATIASLRAIPGVVVAALLRTPCAAGAAFRAPRGSRAFQAADAPPSTPSYALECSAHLGLDLIVNLTRATAAASAPHGVLHLQFADIRHPGRYERRAGVPVSHVYVGQTLGGEMRPVGHACFKTAATVRRNCDKVLGGAPALFARVAGALANGIALPILPHAAFGAATPLHARLARRFSKWSEKLFTRSSWTLGYIPMSVDDLIRRGALPEVTWLRGLPAGRFFADPFPISRDAHSVTALVEDGDSAPPHKGRICELTFETSGRVKSVRQAIRAKEHMSFPFPLRLAGKLYCVPECHESGALQLFGQVGDTWTAERTLLGGIGAVDPVLLHRDGKWWLFCCDRAHDDITNLYIYYAEELNGAWRPHPLNPVKSDVRSSRPAGAIVEVDGALYRPAQDCSRRYGGAIVFQRIDRLSETEFSESTAFTLEPSALGRRFLGLHTINSLGDVTMIDGLRRTAAL